MKTSWRRKAKANIFVLIKTSWRRFLKTKTKDVFKTFSSRRMFAGMYLALRLLIWLKGTEITKIFIPVTLFYSNIYFLKSFWGACGVAFMLMVTFKKCYFGVFWVMRKCINFMGTFFLKCLKCEKGLCKLTVLVFPNTHHH